MNKPIMIIEDETTLAKYPKGYVIYRDMVLAKCPPEHIHTINGKLGIVLNSRASMNYWIETQDFERAASCRDASRKAEGEIKVVTGVSFPS